FGSLKKRVRRRPMRMEKSGYDIDHTGFLCRNMRTHSFDTSFAELGDNRLHCAAATPNPIVKRIEIEACIAPVNGGRSSETEIPMVRRSTSSMCSWTTMNAQLGLKYGAREADPTIAIAAVSHATQAAFLDNDVATAGRRSRRQSHTVALSNGQIYLFHVPRLDTFPRILFRHLITHCRLCRSGLERVCEMAMMKFGGIQEVFRGA
ncbi:predicted protein, partial [Pyrenophora tritici-repentis Pt-1C-BFP]